MQHLRFALRQLRKTPGFTLVAIATLALGIGATTAVFSLVQAVLLNSLPYAHAERLVVGWQTTLDRPAIPFSYPNYLDYAAASQSFEVLALSQRAGASVSLPAGLPQRASAAAVTANYFPLSGLSPVLGRFFTAAEDRPGGEPVVVIGEPFWERHLGRAPDVLGRTLQINGAPHTIIGVMPRLMDLPAAVDLWRPLGPQQASPGFMERGNFPSLYALGRLRPGVTLAQAQTEATAIWAQIKAAHPHTINTGITLQPLLENRVGQFRTGLYLLLGAVGLVLVIACANLAHLLLARGAQRTTEFAVRAALGANRGALVRQLLVEALLLAGAGGLAGIGLAFAARQLIVALSPEGIARFQNVQIDGPMMLFAVALALLCGVGFGLWPAWSNSQVDLRTALQAGGRTAAGGSNGRVRSALIVAEVALTVILLVGAGLLVKSFLRIQRTDLGVRTDKLLLSQVSFPAAKYPEPAARVQFAAALTARLEELPGVEAVAINTAPPLSPNWQTLYFVPDKQYPAGQGAPLTDVAVVSENYFSFAGIPLLRGRNFAPGDVAGGTPVVVIDERMAREFGEGVDVVGKRMSFAGGINEAEIIGVVPTLRLYGYATEPPVPQVYFLHRQLPALSTLTVLVRAKGDPQALRAPLAEIVASIDPDQPVYNVRTLEQDIARTQVSARLYTYLLGCFSALALVLAAVGLYGVISYATAQRTREIGIRMALGAQRGQVFTLIVGHGLRLVLLGGAVGAVGAVLLARVAASLLYGVSTTDPVVYAVVLGLLGVVALAACWWPARRAATVDPLVALRAD